MIIDSGTDGARGHRLRALVLGGGGPVGRAWEIGLTHGFAGQGIDLGTADLIIGTSAGAVVGATLAVIEPHYEFLVLTKHGAAMMDSNLVPEAYRLGHIAGLGEAESVGRVWNSH